MPTAGTGYDADYTAEVRGAVNPSGWCDRVLGWVHLRAPMALCPESPQQQDCGPQSPGTRPDGLPAMPLCPAQGLGAQSIYFR